MHKMWNECRMQDVLYPSLRGFPPLFIFAFHLSETPISSIYSISPPKLTSTATSPVCVAFSDGTQFKGLSDIRKNRVRSDVERRSTNGTLINKPNSSTSKIRKDLRDVNPVTGDFDLVVFSRGVLNLWVGSPQSASAWISSPESYEIHQRAKKPRHIIT